MQGQQHGAPTIGSRTKPIRVRHVLLGACLSLSLAFSASANAASHDVAKFLAQRGADDNGSSKTRSPTPDISPVYFTDKDAYASSCGVLVARSSGTAPAYIELTGPDGRESFPDCAGILSLTQFKLINREYVAVEYLSRETREDVYRQFTYFVRDSGIGYVVDNSLDAGGEAEAVQAGAPSKAVVGIKEARIARLRKTYSQWQLQERHFISDGASSFAVFDDRKSAQCNVVAEAGAAPAVARLSDYVPGARCAGVLASARLAQADTIYYLAMFDVDKAKRVVTVTSVAAGGKIVHDKALSNAINESGATQDMKRAKAALADVLRRSVP